MKIEMSEQLSGSGFLPLVMRRARTAKNKFLIRLLAAFYIISGRYRHWILLNLDEPNFENLIRDNKSNVEIDQAFHGLREYNVHQVIRIIANNLTEEKMILEKAAFQGEAELYRRSEHGA